MLRLRVIFENKDLIVVDKPAGFHSHPPENKEIRLNHNRDCLGILQKQTGLRLYPAHRLDRATSGVLLFSKNRELNDSLHRQFRDHKVKKIYYCLLRGTLKGTARIDQNLDGQEALTVVEEFARFTLPLPDPQGKDRTFTLARAKPVTGRYHQIRRHLAQLGLPIVGDTRHGDRKLNRSFKELTGSQRMLLHCVELAFTSPTDGANLRVRARWPGDWHQLFDRALVCPLV